MSRPEDQSILGDHIEAALGDNASHINVGKDISSVSVSDVHGDIKDTIFAGRDVNIYRINPADIRNQRSHRALRQLVKSFWIDGVLKHSLYNEVLIRLNLQEQPDRVDNRPWNLIQRQPGEADRLLPPNTSIIDVFDQMNQLLLILGEPGSGKTTTLLELTRDLLERAEADSTHPTPVVFNLSSWPQHRQSITDWLVDELHNKYRIPKRMAETWVDGDELLPLLDGLDEVHQENRQECVMAINMFRQEHMMPLVVCCRVAEYELLSIQLRLQAAVVVQPLTSKQIAAYLDKSGVKLEAVRMMIQQDTELQQLATSPLMLSIMSLAYSGLSIAEVANINAFQTRRQHLFSIYIQRMFGRRERNYYYSTRSTLYHLRWLASRLFQLGYTIFLIERIQPSWLVIRKQHLLYVLCTRVLVGINIGLILGLVRGLVRGIFIGINADLLRGVVYGAFIGTLSGLISGVFISYFSLKDTYPNDQVKSYCTWKSPIVHIIYVVIIGSIAGICSSFLPNLVFVLLGQYIPFAAPRGSTLYKIVFGLNIGFGTAVGTWLLFSAKGTAEKFRNEIQMVEKINFSWRLFAIGIFPGLAIGLAFGIVMTFLSEITQGLTLGLLTGFVTGIVSGFRGSVAEVSLFPNQGMLFSFQNSILSLLSLGALSGIIGFLLYGYVGAMMFALVGLCIASLWHGGLALIQHGILRTILYLYNYIPWNYTRFLNHCVDLIFLRKVGGGYIFAHRLLMEHFASLTDKDIERIALAVKESKTH